MPPVSNVSLGVGALTQPELESKDDRCGCNTMQGVGANLPDQGIDRDTAEHMIRRHMIVGVEGVKQSVLVAAALPHHVGARPSLLPQLREYSAFGIMVTLIWLYLEILRLLGKRR
jgi:Bax inhibitor 1 like